MAYRIDEDVFHEYLNFVEQRHMAWSRRRVGMEYPVKDPIVAGKKFTNVFRILDPGTQYVLNMVTEGTPSPRTVLTRAFLYRMTNLPGPWEYVRNQWGHWPYPDPDEVGDKLIRTLSDYRDQGGQVFGGAYIVKPEPLPKGSDKIVQVVRMAERLFGWESPGEIGDKFLSVTSRAQRFAVLRSQKGVGDFIAMQVLTDYMYSSYGKSYHEDDFVVAGPGCRKGIAEITDTRDLQGFMRYTQQRVHDSLPHVNLKLAGSDRLPSLMDIQNTFCEFSKYARYRRALAAGTLKLGRYKPVHNEKQRQISLPAHWQ